MQIAGRNDFGISASRRSEDRQSTSHRLECYARQALLAAWQQKYVMPVQEVAHAPSARENTLESHGIADAEPVGKTAPGLLLSGSGHAQSGARPEASRHGERPEGHIESFAAVKERAHECTGETILLGPGVFGHHLPRIAANDECVAQGNGL
jgi:hypothetical protein